MTRIVTTTYRYKRPPRKQKAVKMEGAATVTPTRKPRASDEAKVAPSANDDRKPAIVSTTSRKRVRLLRAGKRVAERVDDPEAAAKDEGVDTAHRGAGSVGMIDAYHGLPTPRTTLRDGYEVAVVRVAPSAAGPGYPRFGGERR